MLIKIIILFLIGLAIYFMLNILFSVEIRFFVLGAMVFNRWVLVTHIIHISNGFFGSY